jgi:small subunit ribosomal protein S16
VLKIRLRRMGAKKAPFYRIVVSDSRSTPQGRFVDVVGTYDPTTDPAALKLDVVKTQDWIGKGAQPSATVRSLLAQVTRSTPESEPS